MGYLSYEAVRFDPSEAMLLVQLLPPNSSTPDEVLEVLNHYRVRATYGAVAGVLGCHWRQVGPRLGEARPLSSWVVLQDGGMPSPRQFPDDKPELRHPDLDHTPYVIRHPEILMAVIAAFRVRPLTEWWHH